MITSKKPQWSNIYASVKTWPTKLTLPDDPFSLIRDVKSKSLVSQLRQYGVDPAEVKRIIEGAYKSELAIIEILRFQNILSRDQRIYDAYQEAAAVLSQISSIDYLSEARKTKIRSDIQRLKDRAGTISSLKQAEITGKMKTPKSFPDMFGRLVSGLFAYLKNTVVDNPCSYGGTIDDKDFHKLIAELLSAIFGPDQGVCKWDERFIKMLDDNYQFHKKGITP